MATLRRACPTLSRSQEEVPPSSNQGVAEVPVVVATAATVVARRVGARVTGVRVRVGARDAASQAAAARRRCRLLRSTGNVWSACGACMAWGRTAVKTVAGTTPVLALELAMLLVLAPLALEQARLLVPVVVFTVVVSTVVVSAQAAVPLVRRA